MIKSVITEVENFVNSNGAVIGGTHRGSRGSYRRGSARVVGGHVARVLPLLVPLLALLQYPVEPRFGQVMNEVRDILLNPANPLAHVQEASSCGR